MEISEFACSSVSREHVRLMMSTVLRGCKQLIGVDDWGMGALVDLGGKAEFVKAARGRRTANGGADDERGLECFVGDGCRVLYDGFVCAADHQDLEAGWS